MHQSLYKGGEIRSNLVFLNWLYQQHLTMGRTIYFCGFCDYKTDRRYNRQKHILRKHPKPQTKKLHCTFCNCKFEKRYQLMLHKDIIHNFVDSPETQTDKSTQTDIGKQTDIAMEQTFKKSDVENLLDEAFDCFRYYMQPKGFGTKEMIEESIDVSKIVMKEKLCK